VKGLKKARRLFNSGKYTEVVRLLEPEIFQYRESFSFFYLLGISCLYSGDLGGAHSYLKRAQQLREDDVNTHLALAVVYLRKTEKENALRTWLRILEIDPHNRRAQKGLNIVRKYPEPEDMIEFYNSGKIRSLFPPVKKKLLSKVLFFIITILSASVCALLVLIYYPGIMEKKIRPGVEKYILPEKGLLDYSSTERYFYSEKEIREIFSKAKSLFNNYKDNQAIVEINRLLHSNASMDVKSLIYTLKDYMYKPDFSTFKKEDSFSYETVFDDPLLYENCFIRWEGRIGGIQVTETAISFDFWVGDSHEFSGVVPVVLNFASTIKNGQTVEVLGEVKLDQDNKVTIRGIAIRRIVQNE